MDNMACIEEQLDLFILNARVFKSNSLTKLAEKSKPMKTEPSERPVDRTFTSTKTNVEKKSVLNANKRPSVNVATKDVTVKKQKCKWDVEKNQKWMRNIQHQRSTKDRLNKPVMNYDSSYIPYKTKKYDVVERDF